MSFVRFPHILQCCVCKLIQHQLSQCPPGAPPLVVGDVNASSAAFYCLMLCSTLHYTSAQSDRPLYSSSSSIAEVAVCLVVVTCLTVVCEI